VIVRDGLGFDLYHGLFICFCASARDAGRAGPLGLSLLGVWVAAGLLGLSQWGVKGLRPVEPCCCWGLKCIEGPMACHRWGVKG